MAAAPWLATTLVVLLLAACSGGTGLGDLCTPDPCSGHGTCDAVDGEAVCACEAGYAGEACDRCDTGYQDHDGDGACAVGYDLAELDCPAHASCDDSTGEAACDVGYTGELCDACGSGYQDHDGDGECLADCATAGYDCSGHGVCDDASGEALCVCEAGWEPDGQGGCVEGGADGTCDGPYPLDLSAGSVSGSTTGAADHHTGGCVGGTTGGEAVYRFALDSARRVTFETGGFDTVLYLRADCAEAASELACDDDDGPGHDSSIHATLQPGSYFLFADSYGDPGAYELRWRIHTNPCADDEAACPGAPTCEAWTDGSAYDCVCPAGQLPHGGACVTDPCAPNPCADPLLNRCVTNLPGGGYQCECNVGYVDDGGNPGSCVEDPNAAEWAVLLYLNADNNLEEDAYGDASEIESVGSTSDVAEASAPYADYFVGSEANIPSSGYEYEGFLGPLTADPTLSASDLGYAIVESYYQGYASNRTLALTDLAALPALAGALSSFADQLRATPTLWSAFEQARLGAQDGSEDTHRDLYGFTEAVAALSGAPQPLVDAANALLAQLDVSIVHNRAIASYPGSNGLAIYFPELATSMDWRYTDTGACWSDHTTWDEFLADFTN